MDVRSVMDAKGTIDPSDSPTPNVIPAARAKLMSAPSRSYFCSSPIVVSYEQERVEMYCIEYPGGWRQEGSEESEADVEVATPRGSLATCRLVH